MKYMNKIIYKILKYFFIKLQPFIYYLFVFFFFIYTLIYNYIYHPIIKPPLYYIIDYIKKNYTKEHFKYLLTILVLIILRYIYIHIYDIYYYIKKPLMFLFISWIIIDIIYITLKETFINIDPDLKKLNKTSLKSLGRKYFYPYIIKMIFFTILFKISKNKNKIFNFFTITLYYYYFHILVYLFLIYKVVMYCYTLIICSIYFNWF